MNENIDLTKILKNCPKGTKLYSIIYGEVKFSYINLSIYPIKFETKNGNINSVTLNGRHHYEYNGECTLFPSKEQRDWSKFTDPWYKKEKFDPNTLKPFDKVLVRDYCDDEWLAGIFARYFKDRKYPYVDICLNSYTYCIPYNDDTKHLVGTIEDAPEFYRYWEN